MRATAPPAPAALLLLALALLPAGCADLAEGGPTATAIEDGRAAALSYRLVPVTAATLKALDEAEPARLAGLFPDRAPPSRIVLGVGDILSINIYEAQIGGLFVPGDGGARPSNAVSLPNQAIDPAGRVTIPFGGTLAAAGRTPQQLQAAILGRIKDRAIDPQVIVAVVSQQTSLVSVEGEVRSPARYPAAAPGARDRLSDAITRAGGLLGPGWDSWVTLERGGRSATVPFESLLGLADNDVAVQPGDRILVSRAPQRFVALGALGRRAISGSDAEPQATRVVPLLDAAKAEIPFDAWRLSLAAAVAKAGGLLDTRANPGSVFLYRREPAVVARRLGLDPGASAIVPTVFRLDLSDPAGFLLATRFPMRNGDVLYVADARAAEADKAFGLIDAALSTAVSAGTAATVGTSALRGSGSTGLPTVAGLTVVPSSITGQPGTISAAGLADGGIATAMAGTGGTSGTGAAATNGATPGGTVTTVSSSLTAPRATMSSSASR